MHRAMTALITIISIIFVLIAAAPAFAADDEPNLCFTTHADQCQNDNDWQIGWFWANHPPSESSCDLYGQRFGHDAWGMCSGGANASSDGDEKQEQKSEAEHVFELTSEWQSLPEGDAAPCPYEGLDPIIDEEGGSFICATSF